MTGGFWLFCSGSVQGSSVALPWTYRQLVPLADVRRAETRRPLQIVADRVVRHVTRANRAKLLEDFDTGLRTTQTMTLAQLRETPYEHAERIAAHLVMYGQRLFRTGALSLF